MGGKMGAIRMKFIPFVYKKALMDDKANGKPFPSRQVKFLSINNYFL
jgi:hypothetical protein